MIWGNDGRRIDEVVTGYINGLEWLLREVARTMSLARARDFDHEDDAID
jgi:hypothetical protein